eukprot:CAMPEP_0201681058 /NCGR_PEP_ID=MMETSP0494-20130426/50917_1 /ASSEMBLY_ACC=CAM_ASM_000839 /TAXON_ID=420259 /ORGANISM="Thalassiosira gravida, Strain GMp14c1" /LENGTH=117 /DNA_ID=CAMNT_0048164789 /DNA_START=442 /DNA_END=796 /DNA_ORIENTATION=+
MEETQLSYEDKIGYEDHPCDAEFEKVDKICTDETGYDVEKCFESCMEETQLSYEGEERPHPPCPELAATLCSCAGHCAHHAECKSALSEAVKCDLEHGLDCPNYDCAMTMDDEGEEL